MYSIPPTLSTVFDCILLFSFTHSKHWRFKVWCSWTCSNNPTFKIILIITNITIDSYFDHTLWIRLLTYYIIHITSDTIYVLDKKNHNIGPCQSQGCNVKMIADQGVFQHPTTISTTWEMTDHGLGVKSLGRDIGAGNLLLWWCGWYAEQPPRTVRHKTTLPIMSASMQEKFVWNRNSLYLVVRE